MSVVRKMMCDLHVHHISIVNDKKMVGLVSFTDLMKIHRVINGADEHFIGTIIDQQFKLADIMSSKITTIKKQTQFVRLRKR